MNKQLHEALEFFLVGQPIIRQEPLGRGNVNDTWYVEPTIGSPLVLQRLNPHVFTNPGLVQDNLATITSHLNSQNRKKTTDFIPLKLYRNPQGAHSYIAPDGSWWRLLGYIENTTVLDTIQTPGQAYQIGRGLGTFHALTASLHPESLADPLPGFHCTPRYFKQYKKASATSGQEDKECHQFIKKRSNILTTLEKAKKQGKISTRVVHADPKAANFLFSKDRRKVVSLIDLDTVRSGLLLHDLGDCLRSCCNRAGEELHDLKAVSFDADLFTAVLSGYAPFASQTLTTGDRELLVASVHLISFELGLRFYTDYLKGNQYFKVQYPDHNLFRAQVQFALVRSIEEQYSMLDSLCIEMLKGVTPG